MRRITFKRSLQWTAAALWLVSTTHHVAAGSFTLACAARDMQVLMLIEQQESANTASATKMSAAIIKLLDARIVCYEGHVLDALAIYDGIAHTITRNGALSNRAQPAEIH